METIATRVRAALRRAELKQNETAAAVGMTTDALSRALNGQRGFGAVELAEIAQLVREDVHWLITGERDPYRVVASARHTVDADNGERAVSGAVPDNDELANIALAYEQSGTAPPTVLPSDADDAHAALGTNFVADFSNRLAAIGIDVIRIEQLSTAYSFTLSERAVIAINSSGNWFHQNWSLAHELGHLIARDVNVMPDHPQVDTLEKQANKFAANLLLPEDNVTSLNWAEADESLVATFLWDYGISTHALRNRLVSLDISPSPAVQKCLDQKTQAVLRRHHPTLNSLSPDAITERMQSAAQRRFPEWLITAHTDGINSGRLHKATLAWMLDIDEAELEFDQPAPPALLTSDALSDLLD